MSETLVLLVALSSSSLIMETNVMGSSPSTGSSMMGSGALNRSPSPPKLYSDTAVSTRLLYRGKKQEIQRENKKRNKISTCVEIIWWIHTCTQNHTHTCIHKHMHSHNHNHKQVICIGTHGDHSFLVYKIKEMPSLEIK